MNRNLVGRSYIKTAHFVSIHLQTWPPQVILVSDWPISKKSSPLKPLSQMNRNQKQELSVVAIFVNGSKRNEQSLQRTFHRCFMPSFISVGQAVSEKKIY
jgi:hypothetical protein